MKTTDAPMPAAARHHTRQVNGIEMHYEESGAGAPLVLLHGFGGGTRKWGPFPARLSQHPPRIARDLRGHGHSTNPENEFTHRLAARDVSLLLDELGIGRFSAMGISTGGMTLLHMATSQPARIDAMVLISATSHFTDQARALFRRASYENFPRQVQQMYRECAKRGEPQIQQLVAHFRAFHDNHDDMAFTARELSTITARTLVVHGDRDRFFPVEIPLSLYRAIPEAALWIIPGGDHVPIYEATIPFTATALGFIEGQGGKQSTRG